MAASKNSCALAAIAALLLLTLLLGKFELAADGTEKHAFADVAALRQGQPADARSSNDVTAAPAGENEGSAVIALQAIAKHMPHILRLADDPETLERLTRQAELSEDARTQVRLLLLRPATVLTAASTRCIISSSCTACSSTPPPHTHTHDYTQLRANTSPPISVVCYTSTH